jgi:hypothetical protein
MPPLTLRRKITALAFVTALAVPWAAAAAPLARPQPAGPGILQQLWTALTGFRGTGLTPDSGCRMDPDGRCATGSVIPTGTAPTIAPDSGCKMDPNGGCLPGS